MAYIPIEETPNMNLNMDAMTDKTLVVYSEMNARYKQLLDNDKSIAYPAFDDSGSATGFASFNDFLGTVKSKMRIFDFYKNFKAGMQFVMHLGRAANNCSTTAEGLYLDARQGKVLMDLYTKLNSDIDTYYLGVRVRNSCVRGFMEEITFTNGIGTFNISNYYKNFVYHSIVFGVVHVYRPDLDRYIPISFSYDSVDTNTIKVSAIFVNDGSYYSGKVWVPGTVFCSS